MFFFVCQLESYVAHIRGLLEERECLTADCERDNEHLRQELHHMRQQQGELVQVDSKCWLFSWVLTNRISGLTYHRDASYHCLCMYEFTHFKTVYLQC